MSNSSASSIGSQPHGSAGSVSAYVQQASHGFSVSDVLAVGPTGYVLAKADAVGNADVVGIVSMVPNANAFVVTSSGYVWGLSGLVKGATYFLSDQTAGLLTPTEPTASGSVSKPVFVADSPVSGFVVNYRGFRNASGLQMLMPYGMTPPASPNDGDLWLDAGGGTPDAIGCVDLSTASVDYALRRGETATIQFSAQSQVPLRVGCGEGLYELTLVTDTSNPRSTNGGNDAMIRPNGTAYAGAFTRADVQISHAWSASGGATINAYNYSLDQFNWWSGGAIAIAVARVSTFTKSKAITVHVNSNNASSAHLSYWSSLYWHDTTTAWTSLGTLAFYDYTGAVYVSTTGTVAIRRLL